MGLDMESEQSAKKHKAKPSPHKIELGAGEKVEVPWDEGAAHGQQAGTLSATIFVISACLAVVFLSPVFAMVEFGRGLREGDAERIGRFLDSRTVADRVFTKIHRGRPNLSKVQVLELEAFLRQNLSPNGLAGIASLPPDNRPTVPQTGQGFGRYPASSVSGFRYRGLNEVEVNLDDGVTVFFERTGLLGWRVYDISLP